MNKVVVIRYPSFHFRTISSPSFIHLPNLEEHFYNVLSVFAFLFSFFNALQKKEAARQSHCSSLFSEKF